MSNRDNYLAGGSNSPIPYPESYPTNITSGKRALVFDTNGDKYIDMWMGYGALLFGHQDSRIKKIISKTIKRGWFFSYPTLLEKEFSALLNEIIPSAESVRYATTGSDAVAYSIRAARHFTKRQMILSIKGGYHGVHENMISTGGSMSDIEPHKVKFNDIDDLKKAFDKNQYACFILETIMANNGCVPANKEYLEAARDLCNKTGTILIFDEVVTGFRMGLSGAQGYYKITPDLSIFSKAIASGLPISVVCGRNDVMSSFESVDKVFFAGTFNGSPLALNVAKEVINIIKNSDDIRVAEEFTTELADHIREISTKHSLDIAVNNIKSMLSISFGCKTNHHGLCHEKSKNDKYIEFISVLSSKYNILFPPLPTETVFISKVHRKHKKKIFDGIRYALLKTFDII